MIFFLYIRVVAAFIFDQIHGESGNRPIIGILDDVIDCSIFERAVCVGVPAGGIVVRGRAKPRLGNRIEVHEDLEQYANSYMNE